MSNNKIKRKKGFTAPRTQNAEDFPRTKGAEDFPRTKGAEDKPPEAPLGVASRSDSVGKTQRAQRKNRELKKYSDADILLPTFYHRKEY